MSKYFISAASVTAGTIVWHRSQIWNVNQEGEEVAKSDPNLSHQVLMLTAAKDPIGTAKAAESIRDFAANLTLPQVDAGHWP